MSAIIVVSGSPAPASRTLAVCQRLCAVLRARGEDADVLDVREIPAEDLLGWHLDSPAVRTAGSKIQRAPAVVLVTPIYNAAYTGALKAFLDILPEQVFADKVVLPVCIAGSPAHLLAIDYALRPVLASMGAPRVLRGALLLQSSLPRNGAGAIDFIDETEQRIRGAIDDLDRALSFSPSNVDTRRGSAVMRKS